MIEILLAKINKLTNKLVAISKETSNDMYGDGLLGNVFYGNNATVIPQGYQTVFNDRASYILPVSTAAHYKNLYIDNNTLVETWGDYGTVLVQDTLYLNGSISVARKHSGDYKASSGLPTSYEQFTMYGETTLLYNTNFFVTGGTNNPMFGNAANGGGCLVVYYSNLLDKNGVDRGTNWGRTLNYLGGNSGDKSGGCLLISARNVVLGDSPTIDASGGDGLNPATAGIALLYKLKSVSI